MIACDIAVVGAGIAGASLAAALAPHASVVMLEAESLAGMHATGRSAAFWSETYGGPRIQPLTTASGPSLAAAGVLSPMGTLHIGRAGDAIALDAMQAAFAGQVTLARVDPHAHVPGLRLDWTQGLWEPSCAAIDVAALHAHYLKQGRAAGARLLVDAGVESATRAPDGWRIETRAGPIRAATLVDAAGAWADAVAQRAGVRPIGIRAFRRTMVQLRTDPPASATLPHVSAIDGSFYFRPEAGGRLWLTPHDEIASDPCDAQPEELDVATAIDRLEHCVDWQVAAVERRWAGLRSFAPDRLPVLGEAADAPGFWWCAGQGGFGIQTAPAAAALLAALILGCAPDPMVAGIDPATYRPQRLG